MKNHYQKLHLVRLISCIGVLLYHLNILKGGYLAVCTFFVLSGYLACASAFKKEKFSFKDYYLNKLKKLYLPLVIVVFSSIAVISLFPNIFWMNLKPETTSVLLGYNNYWQLNANLDYFTLNISSPFMHLWFTSILIQFDLVFPFIFVGLFKLKKKLNKFTSCTLATVFAAFLCVFFYFMSFSDNMMSVYYGTFTRCFSLFLGLALGFIYNYYKTSIKKIFKHKTFNKLIFYLNLIILISLFIFTSATSKHFALIMIISSGVSCALIHYATLIPNKKETLTDKIISSLSYISYEIYLFQYPVIYLFQGVNINGVLKVIIIILITVVLSYLLHFCLKMKSKNYKVVKYLLLVLFSLISVYGVYQYAIAKDYTEDMQKLKEQLEENEKILQEKQEEYMINAKKEEEDWQSALANLENGEEQVKTIVSDLPVVGIGDSVMLGAVSNLYEQFPNSYFDAKLSRTAYVAKGIIQDLKAKNMFGDPVIFNLGANGDCNAKCKEEVMAECEGKHVFWLTVTNDADVDVNSGLFSLASQYNNLHIIDWKTISLDHPEYFAPDRIHLTSSGRAAYTNALYDGIYNVYLEEYKQKQQELIKEHDEKEKTKITFYGNNILLNVYDFIKDDFKMTKFDINKDYTYETLSEVIKKEIEDKSINYRLVFVFDSESKISVSEYQKLFALCEGKEIYLLSTDPAIVNGFANNPNVKVIDFAKIIQENSNYVFVDGVHLSNDGNVKLKDVLNETLNKKDN